MLALQFAQYRTAIAQTSTLASRTAAIAQSNARDSATEKRSVTRPLVTGENFRLDSGRFTVVANRTDSRLAHAMLAAALARDTFPGLPKPSAHVLIAIAPSAAFFRAWVGPNAPEWGAAIAIPDEQRIVMQGAFAGSDAGDPFVVLRHELAHLALHEALGDLPPRWFDEGYASVAAGEWSRTTALETSVSLAWRSMPGGDELNDGFYGGSSRAEYTYALSHLAVAEMQAIDEKRGLANFFAEWKRTGKYDLALRQAFGMTASSFDNYWHTRVRRQYGALALFANLSLAFGFVSLMLGPIYWAKRRRTNERLAVMRANEAVQEARDRQSALYALLALELAMPVASDDEAVVVQPDSLMDSPTDSEIDPQSDVAGHSQPHSLDTSGRQA
ncbi:MAG: hypothetical protein ABI120_17400 [Gemmatimonadaceae bacterium]